MSRASGTRVRATKVCVIAMTAIIAMCESGVVSASASSSADDCSNAAVRAQQQGSGLPDLPECRAYEIVDPPTDDVGETNRVSNISDDGNAVAYMSVIPGNQAFGGAVSSTAVARRGAMGWTSVSADPVSEGAISNQTASTVPRAFSPDFSRELLSTNLPANPLDLNGGYDYYWLDVGKGTGTMIAPYGVNATQMFGASPKLDRVVFKGNAFDIYVTDGNSLEQVSVDPDGVPMNSGLGANVPGAGFQRGLGVGDGRETGPWVERGGNHAVSDDARRIYFTSSVSGSTYLYVRDLAANPVRTIPVSASKRTIDPPGTLGRASFISGTRDGSIAYFASPDQLYDTAAPGGGIYRFNLTSQSVTQITPDSGDPTGFHLWSAIASDDQSHLYFTTTAALTSGAQAGDTNAYVWTSATGLRFIAKVGTAERFVRVTPDGRYALLPSAVSIDGASNNGFQAIYRYDSETEKLVCVSCRGDGSPSNGNAAVEGQSPGFPAGPNAHSRSFTLDGRVVFTSTDRLVASDQTSANDVYLYHDGTVSLLTAGRGDDDSYVGDVSDDGRNILIISRSALVRADRDADEFDVYDVRVDGGFLESPLPTDPCRSDDCQTSSSPPSDKYIQSSSRATEAGESSTSSAKKLRLRNLASSQRSMLARTGQVVVRAEVTGGGTLAVRGRGRIAGRTRTLGSASKVVLKEAATTVRVMVRLSSAARRELARNHHLSVTFEGRLSGLPKVVSTAINLDRPHR